VAAAVAAVLAVSAARGIESAGEHVRMTGAERHRLERLIFMCHLRLAERQASPAAAAGHLAEAERSAAWFRAGAERLDPGPERSRLEAECRALAAHLASGWGRAAQRLERADPGGAAGLLRRRAEWLDRSLPAEAGVGELLALAELRLELGENQGCLEACRRLLGRHDPDGDGARAASGTPGRSPRPGPGSGRSSSASSGATSPARAGGDACTATWAGRRAWPGSSSLPTRSGTANPAAAPAGSGAGSRNWPRRWSSARRCSPPGRWPSGPAAAWPGR
jgi:hypothetical protein